MSDENKISSAPPWRTETWRLTHGPEGDRQTRWFLARLNDGEMLWSLTEPGTPHFIAGTLSPADGVALMAVRAVDPVIEKMDPGSPDDLRAEIDYMRWREAYFASVLKVADGGQYRADWKAPLQRVLDENKALHDEVDALRDGQEAVRLALLVWVSVFVIYLAGAAESWAEGWRSRAEEARAKAAHAANNEEHFRVCWEFASKRADREAREAVLMTQAYSRADAELKQMTARKDAAVAEARRWKALAMKARMQ